MEPEPQGDALGVAGRFLRNYARGLGILVLVGLLARLLAAIWPADAAWAAWDWLSDGPDHWLLTVTAVLFLPTVLGWSVVWLLGPLLARRRQWRALLSLEDRMATELAPDDRRGYPIVVVDWPSPDAASIGVMTSVTRDPDRDIEIASVFLPSASDPLKGSLRVIPVDKLRVIDWTLQDFFWFYTSLGAVVPTSTKTVGELLRKDPSGD